MPDINIAEQPSNNLAEQAANSGDNAIEVHPARDQQRIRQPGQRCAEHAPAGGPGDQSRRCVGTTRLRRQIESDVAMFRQETA